MFVRLFAITVGLWGFSDCGSAAFGAETDLRERVDRLAAPYVEHQVVMGMTVGVLAEGRQLAVGYGSLAVDQKDQPNGDTIFEIGSVSKAFTGILLGDAVARGVVTLKHPVQELLPDGITLPVEDQQPMQLWHLATHTSGLPQLPLNLRPADPNNPYADYSAEQLYQFLNNVELQHVPGSRAEYSNLGVGLLGHLLARQEGVRYGELLTERIAKPMQMTSTAIELSTSQRARLAPPHSADGQPALHWDLPTLAGAGAIRSSANDMLRLLAAQLEPPRGTLGQGINQAWEVHWTPPDSASFAMGLGWHVRDGHTRWHNGQTGGYHAMALVSRKSRTAVVLLANTATGEVDRLAEDIFRMLHGATVQPRRFAPALVVAPEVMRRYVGRYTLAPGVDLAVTLDEDRLMVQVSGQPAARVYPKSETRWYLKVVKAELTFQVDDQGNCRSLVLHQNGRDIPAQRRKDETP